MYIYMFMFMYMYMCMYMCMLLFACMCMVMCIFRHVKDMIRYGNVYGMCMVCVMVWYMFMYKDMKTCKMDVYVDTYTMEATKLHLSEVTGLPLQGALQASGSAWKGGGKGEKGEKGAGKAEKPAEKKSQDGPWE